MSSSSKTTKLSNGTGIRRGPTLRGGKSRRSISRNISVAQRQQQQQQHQHVDEEEKIGLTTAVEQEIDYQEDDDSNESIAETDFLRSEKVELDEHGKPVYEPGDETFGDILTQPIEELHAHQARKGVFRQIMSRWSMFNSTDSVKNSLEIQKDHSNSSVHPSQQNLLQYSTVLHFRQLRGNQKFALSHDLSNVFHQRLNFTQQERIQFNGIHDTDGLTQFLYKTKRDFSIKIHHKTDAFNSIANRESAQHIDFLPHLQPHRHDNSENQHFMEFNDNLFIEFKLKHDPDHHHGNLSVARTRRPFFRHPDPDLSTAIGEETAASWLELFYDLFFVATLTQFTHRHHINDWASVGLYTQWFVITWWAWFASSLYTSRFDTDDVMHHIYRLVEMWAVIGMAGSSDYFLNEPGYVYGYITLKAVLVAEYSVVLYVAVLAKSKSRIALAFYVCSNLLSIALWVASITIIEKNTHRILWYLGIVCEVLVNVIVRGDKALSWAASHLAERLGLLSLIVLGENLMGLVTLVSEVGKSSIVIIAANFMAVIIIFGFFFMYFEDFNKEIFLHNKYHQIWVYLHFPLHLCQVAFGISLIDLLKLFQYQEGGKSKKEHSASKPTADKSSTENTSSEETSSAEQHSSTEASTHAKRAIEMIQDSYTISGSSSDNADSNYNPMKLAQVMTESNAKFEMTDFYTNDTTTASPFLWTTAGWFKYITVSIITTIQMIGTNNEQQPSLEYHHLARRSEPIAGSGGEQTWDQAQISFAYKTFLIFAGLILTINSCIKALNTKLSDKYGKIIILSRILNAIVLWSMCALPFSKLYAIGLLATLLVSLVVQAMIDLLD